MARGVTRLGRVSHARGASEALAGCGEVELAQRAARGEREAREAVVVRLLQRVRNLVAHMVRNRAEADDLSQIALVEVLNSVKAFRGDCPLANWADRIVVRVVCAHFRKRGREEDVVLMHAAETTDRQTTHLVDSDLMLREQLSKHLHRLSDERRVVVTMRLIGGCSLEEISEMTEASVNTVKDRLRVGRLELRQSILSDPGMRGLADEVLSERGPHG